MEATKWEFDLELTGSSVTDVMNKANTLSNKLNPILLGGLQDFTPNAMTGWVWQGIVNDVIKWKRDKVLWFSDRGISVLKGKLTILTPNPYGYSAPVVTSINAAGNLAVADSGNAGYYPVVEFRGVPSATQSVNVGGTQIVGPLLSTQTMVFDFENLEYYIKTTGGAKVRNVADRMATHKRVFGKGGMNVAVSISGGTFTQATASVRSRRV